MVGIIDPNMTNMSVKKIKAKFSVLVTVSSWYFNRYVGKFSRSFKGDSSGGHKEGLPMLGPYKRPSQIQYGCHGKDKVLAYLTNTDNFDNTTDKERGKQVRQESQRVKHRVSENVDRRPLHENPDVQQCRIRHHLGILRQ